MLNKVILFFLSAIVSFGATKPITYNTDNEKILPTKLGIVVAKDIEVRRFQQDFRLFIDTTSFTNVGYPYMMSSRVPNDFYYKDSTGTVQRTLNSAGETRNWFSYTYMMNDVEVQYPTDAEIKGIDHWGNLIYFTTTIALDYTEVQYLHPQFIDRTIKVFFWQVNYYNDNGGCWGQLVQLTDFSSSVGATANGYGVTGVWVYPSLDSTEERAIPVYKGANTLDTTNYPRKGNGNNSNANNLRAGYRWVVWGEYVREIFNNPKNTFLMWRQTISTGEYHEGNKLWKPLRIEYYGDFKEIRLQP